jgi:D-arabinose 1-dehydrogenase-like Zn-dependent alcohol dehydrogenase
MSSVIPGLAVRGRLVVVGVGADPIQISAFDLIMGSRTVVGHASGASIDSQDTLASSEAYDKMMRNEARFRMVLTMGA